MIGIRAINALKGKPCDAPMLSHDDGILPLPVLSDAERENDYISVPMPEMGPVERVKQAAMQMYLVLCALPLKINNKYGNNGLNH